MGFNSKMFTVTNAGFALFAKTQNGGTIKYTRFALGDGDIGGASASTLKTLLSERAAAVVESARVSGTRCTLGTKLLMTQVAAPFYWRELGIFAMDGSVEILYAYSSTSMPEYVDPAGGTTDKILSAQMEVGTAQVVIEIVPSAMLVSFDDLKGFMSKETYDSDDDGTVDKAALSSAATKLQTPRTIGLSGKATAAGVAFDGTQNISLNVTDVDATKLNGQLPAYYAAATKQFSASVAANLWTGSSAPYMATVPVSGVPANAKGSVGLADSATAAEREAARNAMITPGTSAAANQVVLVADGDKPTIALPIVVTVWG